METKKNIYFLSDLHLGFPNHQESIVREKKVVAFLDSIKDSTKELYFLGDIFDYWYEYKKVIPKGFSRFLGKICEFTDNNIPVHFFTGNHDVWMSDYLEKELGVIIHKKPIEKTLNNKTFFLGHGDALGPGDKSFKFLKKMFSSKTLQWFYSRIHPNASFSLAHAWSKKSRNSKPNPEKEIINIEKELLVLFAQETLKTKNIDFFIFGHRHILLDYKLNDKSQFFNIGDWLNNDSYAVFDGSKVELKKYKP